MTSPWESDVVTAENLRSNSIEKESPPFISVPSFITITLSGAEEKISREKEYSPILKSTPDIALVMSNQRL